MRRFCYLFLFYFIFSSAVAQTTVNPKSYAETITVKDFRDLLTIIASDALEGRETGTRGQKMAAAFIKYHFKKLGLEPPVPVTGGKSYYQEIPLIKNVPGEIYVKIDNQKLNNFREIVYWGSGDLKKEISMDVVFAGNGEEAVYEIINVEGKGVLIYPGSGFRNWMNKSALAYSKGAEAVFMVTSDTHEDHLNQVKQFSGFLSSGRLSLSSEDRREGNMGIFFLSPDHASALFSKDKEKLNSVLKKSEEEIEALKKVKVSNLSVKTERITETVISENVLGLIEGTDLKEEVLVLTAHYDHIGKNGNEINNGADDDGSGTTAIMEIAEAFAEAKKHGNGPRRSILFMAVSGEEKGLLGSEYYTINPVFPLENTIVNLNIDMIGRVDPKHKENPEYVYLVGSNRLSTELHEISEKVNQTYTQLELDYTYNEESHPERIYYRSDHWNFAKNNVPIIFYFNGTHEDYHKPTDTVDKINFDILEKRARLIFFTAWTLANRDNKPIVDKLKDDSDTSQGN